MKNISIKRILALCLTLALLAAMPGVLPVPVAHAATITVNSNADTVVAGDGNCTLREAINNANIDGETTDTDCAAGTGADIITLPAGTYYLTGAAGNDDNSSGDLDITDDLTINGAGAGSTIIDGNGNVTNDRVFHITAGGFTVNISDVTIQNGNTVSPGGGIYSRGTVTITDSTVSGNQAWVGGGIHNYGGTVNITDSTLSGNQSTYGGGINNDQDGTVNITDSTLSGNQATYGGGIRNYVDGTVNITDSTLSGNEATDSGGGIHNYGGTVTIITNSTLSGNQATDDGGGIYNYTNGTVTIADSTLSANKATGNGGGIFNDDGTVNITNSTLSANQSAYGGGICNNIDGTATVTDSTFSGNQSTYGGGIYSRGTVTITNSTLSANQATGHGGGIYSRGTVTITNSTLSANQATGHGGGIRHWDGTTNLNNVTITNNTADNDNNGSGDGGGIFRNLGAVNLKNVILAGNTDKGTEAPDCSGTLTTSGDNIVQNTTGCTLSGTGTNNNVDPLLGGLADNGGATQTHALQAGSQAIDTITECTDIASNPVTTDQRGVARPQGAACDIGAYEAAPDLSIGKTVVPTTDVTYHGTVTYTVVLSNSGAIDAIGILLTDTLPSEVDFARWVNQPASANQANDQITWSGTVSASTAITFAFVVTHTGNYGDVVTNTVEYSNAISGSDDATFTVIPATYLPIIQTNNVITP